MLIPCSRNAHDQNVLVRRAQWEIKQSPIPGERNERVRREHSKWCSRNARPRKGLARRAQVDQHGYPSKGRETSELEGAMQDHCLPQASFHKPSSRLPGKIRSHMPFPELRSRMLPFPILPATYMTVSPSKRCLAQSYFMCAFADKYETPALVCAVLKSNSTHIVTKSPSRHLVLGSA